jgi:hypothetical protein
MDKRDPERTRRLRSAVGYLIDKGHDSKRSGYQSRLAAYFNVTRQRVHQIFVEERKKRQGVGSEIT